jgi:hypothetical protein
MGHFDPIMDDAPYMKKPFIFKNWWSAEMSNADALNWAQNTARAYSFIVESGNSKYDSRNGCGCIINSSTNTLLVGSEMGFIPESVTGLGTSCFYSSRIKEIEIPP